MQKRTSPQLVFDLVAAFALFLLAAAALCQPVGPHGELVDPCFLNTSSCIHESLFSSADCNFQPGNCASYDGDGPIDCYVGGDPSAYARWAWGVNCKNCVPHDVKTIIQNFVPPTNPTQADFDRAGQEIQTYAASWLVNPGLPCPVWREQLRSYFCLVTVTGKSRCQADLYPLYPTPTLTPKQYATYTPTPKGSPTWTPTGFATVTASPSRTATSTSTPVPSATPTARTIVVGPRPTIGPPTQPPSRTIIGTAVPTVTPTTPPATASSTPTPAPSAAPPTTTEPRKGPCGGSYGLVTATLIAAAGVLVKR